MLKLTDHVKGNYLIAIPNHTWSIDATFIHSGTLLILIDVATRLIIGDLYLHTHKGNQFEAQHAILLIKKCTYTRRPPCDLIVHSDKGSQFTSNEFVDFCQSVKIKHSVSKQSRGNQVSESLFATLKRYMRLKVDPKNAHKKPGSFADPLRKLSQKPKEEIQEIIKFAIEAHNNNVSEHNQKLTPNEFDLALTRSILEGKGGESNTKTLMPLPSILATKNNQSDAAKHIRQYREDVAIRYAGGWIQFFTEWKETQDQQFEQAKQERQRLLIQIHEQTDLIHEQTDLIKEQKEQIQILIDELNARLEKEKRAELRRLKRKNAVKKPLRDAIRPDEFETIFNSIEQVNLKAARVKVAITLLYLTGLRVSNLLQFRVFNIRELAQHYTTLIPLIKKGGRTKIAVPSQAKTWFKRINPHLELLLKDKDPQHPVFLNKKGELISRERFNAEINKALRDALPQGRRIYTHSFRVSMITELLQNQSIQSVKTIIGHKDIRTTEVYNRNFMNERELRKAMSFVYKRRDADLNREKAASSQQKISANNASPHQPSNDEPSNDEGSHEDKD